MEALFPGYHVCSFGTGSLALAAALRDACERRGWARPEAILPAYGCPDLVAACEKAGVFPRLVDVAAGSWGYDLVQLEAAVCERTVALIAVNLLGVGDQGRALASIAARHRIALIQDSAQYLPATLPASFVGDYVLFSFGRGKPLNLLGGGLLLCRSQPVTPVAVSAEALEPVSLRCFAHASISALAFNLLTSRSAFGAARRLLRGRLGVTRFKAVSERRFNPAFRAVLEREFADFQREPGYDADIWSDLPKTPDGRLRLLIAADGVPAPRNRLRLAVLAESRSHRDKLLAALDRRGLGASPMYGASLDRLEGVPQNAAEQGPFPNAVNLADRLLTLPTHSQVSAGLVGETIELVGVTQA